MEKICRTPYQSEWNYLKSSQPKSCQTNGDRPTGMRQNQYVSPEGWELEYLTFPGLSALPGVRHLFTTRKGGVSKGCFAQLNLSFTRGDEQEAVLENYRRVTVALGTTSDRIVCSDQTHTTNVRVVTSKDAGKGVVLPRDYTDVDGMITNEKGLALATFYADCVPLYFVDPIRGVIGLSHSGWRGTVAGMGGVTVRRMTEEFGCDPKDIHAAIGPSICQACYEVSRDVANAFAGTKEEFEQVFTQKDGRQRAEGKYQMNLWKANELVLLAAGILPEHLEVTDICTSHNADYLFSHRASNGKRGNLGAFLMLL